MRFIATCLVTAAMTLPALPVRADQPQDDARRPVRSLLEIRRANVVVQEWDISCGAAALATLLTYQHGDPVAEREVAETMLQRTDPLKVKVRQGFSLLDLKRYAESRGFVGDGYAEMTMKDLLEFGPAIVPVRLHGYDHFVIFRGLRGDRVLLADPAFGNRTMPADRFEEAWEAKIAFVIRRPDGLPPPDLLAPRDEEFDQRPPNAALQLVLR